MADANSSAIEEAQGHHAAGPHEYIPYTRALTLLQDRLCATPHDVAAWVYLGPRLGGLLAYESANELTKPPRFSFSLQSDDGDAYLNELAYAWFRLDEIEAFEPDDRYITGAELRARWSYLPGLYGMSADAWILAKIQESRLLDTSPRTGLSQWSCEDKPWATSRDMALFSLAHVEAIEREDGLRLPLPVGAGRPTRHPHTVRGEEHETENLRIARKAMKLFPSDCKTAQGEWIKAAIARVVNEKWTELSGRAKRETGLPLSVNRLSRIIDPQALEEDEGQ